MPLTDLHNIMSPPYSLLNRQASPQANHLPPFPRLSHHLSQADSPVMRRLPLSPPRSRLASRRLSLLCIPRSRRIPVHIRLTYHHPRMSPHHPASPHRIRVNLRVSLMNRRVSLRAARLTFHHCQQALQR